MSKLTDTPVSKTGRAIVITSGNHGKDEKAALVMASYQSNIYYGHAYGDTSFAWEQK